MATGSKALDCGHSVAGIVGSSPAGSHTCLSLVSGVCYQVEISTVGSSQVQASPTKYVSKCDREVSRVRRPWEK